MKKLILITALTIIAMSITACKNKPAGNGEEQLQEHENTTRVLVAYFSATGNTKAAAEKLASVTGGELHAIEPATAYTAADLDWHDKSSRSSVEMNDPAARPEIKNADIDMAQFDTIYVGYPIWWYICPRVINTFVETYNLKGKTIRVFATSGSSSIDGSLEYLRKTYPELTWTDGALLNGATEADIRQWVEGK